MIYLNGLAKCSTCQKALTWLSDHGVACHLIDYRETPLSPQALCEYSRALGGWEALVNRASMTWRQLSDVQRQAVNDDQWLALIAQFPTLIRRPLTVLADGTVISGFSEKKFKQYQDRM
uniref:Spx/MgsR family RNA polymerase-binding regulatory protein n=1 Tax=Orrella sp. TaxID=1921583 RepID=UPI0040482D93